MKAREDKLVHKAPEAKKPYSVPRLVKHGDLRKLTRGGRGRGNDGGGPGTHTRICWIAEALYGAADPRTHLLRVWLVDVYSKTAVGSIVVGLYKLFGRELAALVRRSSLLRRMVRPFFEAGLVRAHRHFISSAC